MVDIHGTVHLDVLIRRGGDLIALLIYFHLGEYHAILAGPGADQMCRLQVALPVETATEGFPVYGDDLAGYIGLDRPHPGQKALLDLLRIQPVEDPAIHIVAGNPVLKEQASLATPFRPAIPLDVFPAFGAA